MLLTSCQSHLTITTMANSQDPALNPFTNKAYSAFSLHKQKSAQALPVSIKLPQLLEAIRQNNVVIVAGVTGTGKTTQLPKAILLADSTMGKARGKMLALTQDRELAAEMVNINCSLSRLFTNIT